MKYLGNGKTRKIIIEWSGMLTLKNIEKVKKLPLDRVSIGKITHSENALDFL